MKFTGGLFSFFLFGFVFFLHGNSLLNVTEGLIKQNPFQAYQVLQSINPASLSDEDRHRYTQIHKDLMFFRLPIHKLGLSDGNISALASDAQDLWLGDWLGSVSRYNLSSGEALNIRKGRPSQNSRSINHILIEKNQVWIVASDAIITYEKKSGVVNTLANPYPGGKPMMLVRLNNILYLAMKNLGLYQWNGETFIPSPTNDQNIAACQVIFTYQNTLWIGTTSGLFRFDGENWQNIEAFSKKNITAAWPDTQAIWIATQKDGLYAYDPQNQSFEHFMQDSSRITSIFLAKKILFAGMYKGGLAKIQQNKPDGGQLNQLSPALLHIGSLSYHDPYLIVGTLGDAVFFVHCSLF